jgi:hypothetical protein
MTDARILQIANNLIIEAVTSEVVTLRQEYFLTSTDMATVADQREYKIPKRSVGRTLRDLKMKSTSGLEPGQVIRDMALISIEDSHLYGAASNPHSFFFKGDKLVLVGDPSGNEYLNIWYEIKPNKLVSTSRMSTVVSIAGTTVTVDGVPSNITASSKVDFIDGEEGHWFVNDGTDITTLSITSTTIQFSDVDDIPTDLKAGDYICTAQESGVFQFPDVVYPYLEALMADRILFSVGDFDGQDRMKSDIKRSLSSMQKVMQPRILGESKKIISRNGLLRSSRIINFRGSSV